MFTLSTKLENLPTFKKIHLTKLKKLHIETIEDLLRHVPSRYDDFSEATAIEEIRPNETYTIQGVVTSFDIKKTWKRKMIISEAHLQDETGSVKVLFFGLRNLDRTFRIGSVFRISGKVSVKDNELTFTSPSFELASRTPTHTGRLVPTYPETQGISSKWLRWQIQTILKSSLEIDDPIPSDILEKLHLPDLKKAFRYLHFPTSKDHFLLAQKRFAFEEMFLLQLKSLEIRNSVSQQKSVALKWDEFFEKKFLETLSFTLTPDQTEAVQHISQDLEKSQPMNRLLNGDVGSGKTIVALMAMLQAAQNGSQAVLLAPTEVLAYQHYQSMKKLLESHDISLSLMTRSYRFLYSEGEEQTLPRKKFLDRIASGESEIIIGTHALIQKDIHFSNVALVIIDEQHRFGVSQRAYIQQNASEMNTNLPDKIPHFLTMTATPIPRTLTLAFFGDLDISLLETMPKGRKKIHTKIVAPNDREKIYAFIRSEVAKGRQAYVILPLVETSEHMEGIKAATEEHQRLANEIFPDLRLGLLHGKMKSEEKESVMQDFKDKKLDILVATSVVEVGVDVPNSTVIVIEDAERFGLSQLHQFRGRVGRSEHQSYCFLFSGADSLTRLKVLENNANGFEIAKKDLEIRGPGEFLGTRQSGIPDISMENITNVKLITVARQEAQALLAHDPKLKNNPLLRNELDAFGDKMHME